MSAPFLSPPGRHVALHHADGVLREEAAVVAGALPVAVGDLGDDLAALLDGLEDEADVELAADGGLDADLDVVEVDEDGDAVAVFSLDHAIPAQGASATGLARGGRCWSIANLRERNTRLGWPVMFRLVY